ncbi:MAG: Ig-like domain-containing protein, partial [bacterium]
MLYKNVLKKKTFHILLIVFSLLIILIGCGKDYGSGGSGGFAIVSRSPALEATDVLSTESIVISFNRPVDIGNMNNNYLNFAPDHNAGDAYGSGISATWSNNNQTFTISSIQGWTSFETASSAPVRVHWVDSGGFFRD